MKRSNLTTIALIFFMALACQATDTRVMTLGDANNILKDEANVFLYPSLITSYKNLVLGEIDNMGLTRIGGHLDLGASMGVVGVYLDKKGLPGMQNAYRPYIGGNGIDNRLNLIYGLSLNKTDFGAAVSLYHDSYKIESDTTQQIQSQKQSNTTLSLALGYTWNKCFDLTAGITLDNWTWKIANGDDASRPEGNNIGYSLMSRYRYGFTEKVDFIPHTCFKYATGGFVIGDYPSYTVADSQRSSWKDFTIDLGWGVNVRPSDHLLIALDLGVLYTKTKSNFGFTGGSLDTLNLPELSGGVADLPYFRLGLEGQLTKWLDFRMGAVKRWERIADEWVMITTYYWQPTEIENWTEISGESLTSTYLGLGFHFKQLDMDIWMDPNLVLQGPFFLTGYTNQLATMASLKYHW